jgi:hypothetical protein
MMPKKRTPKRRKMKRGPKEERLKISGHPQDALDRLLKKADK